MCADLRRLQPAATDHAKVHRRAPGGRSCHRGAVRAKLVLLLCLMPTAPSGSPQAPRPAVAVVIDDTARSGAAVGRLVRSYEECYHGSMSIAKARLTVTVDPDLVGAGQRAVAQGSAGSLSAWVNLAMAERAEKERRLRALGEAIAAYEREHGSIGDDEMAAQVRQDRAVARVVRGRPRGAANGRRRRRGPVA